MVRTLGLVKSAAQTFNGYTRQIAVDQKCMTQKKGEKQGPKVAKKGKKSAGKKGGMNYIEI